MSVLVIAQHDNASLTPANRNVIAAGSALGPVTVLVAGKDCSHVAEQAATVDGVARVLCCDHDIYEFGSAEPLASLAAGIAGSYSHVLGPANSFGKSLLPRIAALLDVSQISDVTAVIDEATFKRPLHAGNVIATVRSRDAIKVVTVRTTAFAPAGGRATPAEIDPIDAGPDPRLSQLEARELARTERPDLGTARVVVAGGGGLRRPEDVALLERLADLLGGAVGGSRAAVDNGYLPNDAQIGQTGKVVAPELYIAVGISGAVQHVAGMRDSGIIVAINKDSEAPIFKIADYGVVGDWYDLVPQFIEALGADK